jgi:hypothetical protein
VGDEDGVPRFFFPLFLFDPDLLAFLVYPFGDSRLQRVLSARFHVDALLAFVIVFLLRLGIPPLLRISSLLGVLSVFGGSFINQAFDVLKSELKDSIEDEFKKTRKNLLENFDEEVHEKLKINLQQSTDYLTKFEN